MTRFNGSDGSQPFSTAYPTATDNARWMPFTLDALNAMPWQDAADPSDRAAIHAPNAAGVNADRGSSPQ